jgi:hypothetical protein
VAELGESRASDTTRFATLSRANAPRFFHICDHFDDKAVDRYVKTNPDMIGLLAETQGRPLGVAHAFFIDEGCAEITFVVTNDGRHLGVGRNVARTAPGGIAAAPMHVHIAYALAQNRPCSNLARSLGCRFALTLLQFARPPRS